MQYAKFGCSKLFAFQSVTKTHLLPLITLFVQMHLLARFHLILVDLEDALLMFLLWLDIHARLPSKISIYLHVLFPGMQLSLGHLSAL